MQKIAELSLLILSGGRATRMSGQDKGLVLFNQRPMVEHLIDRFSPQVDTVLISCNRNFEQYQQFGYPLVNDQQSDFSGPLAGIEAGLAACKTAYLLVIPCDMPLLPKGLIERLWQPITDQTANKESVVTVAHDGERLQVLVMMLPRTCQASIQQYLTEGGRSVHGWLKSQATQEVVFPNEQTLFTNINSQTELAEQESKQL